MGGPTGGRGGAGRTPTAPLAAAISAALVYGLLLVQVLTTGPLLWVDHVLRAGLAVHRDPVMVEAAVGIGLATGYPGEVIAGLVLALLVAVRTRAPTSLLLGVAGMLALLAVPATKALVGRARPDIAAQPIHTDYLGNLANDAAFPSGHAATSTVFAGLVFLLLAPHLSRVGRRVLAVAAIGYATAVGASRVYLGVHWFTDVLGGWALGVAVIAGLAIVARLQPESPTQKRNEP